MKSKSIYLLGMSGHALSVLDGLHSNELDAQGYFDFKHSELTNLPYLGCEQREHLQDLVNKENAVFFPCVGDNALRERLTNQFKEIQQQSFNIVHRNASVSASANLSTAIFIGAGAIVNAKAQLGTGVIVNTGAIVEHECQLADFVHLGPGSVLAGNVTVGKGTFVGANSTIIQGITIGENCIIGAGSVVINDIESNTVVVGNPARFIRNND